MTIYREQRGSCLIEAGARDLEDGRHWQPWLRLTRRTGDIFTSYRFDRLKPVFGAEANALGYAAELGKNLADEGWGLDAHPATRDRKAAARPQPQAIAQSCAHRARKSPLAQGCGTARHMVRALTGLFARGRSVGDMPRQPHIDSYLSAAASHAELEWRMREMERSAVSFAVTFSH